MRMKNGLPGILLGLWLLACAGAGNGGTNSNNTNSSNNTTNNSNNTNSNNCTVCTVGHQRCVEGKRQTCIEHAPCPTWENTENCTESGKICTQDTDAHTAACVVECTPECTVGESACAGNVIQDCVEDASGCPIFDAGQDCAFLGQVCIYDGLTQTASCIEQCTSNCTTENETRCQNNRVETCTRSGNCLNWTLSADCAAQGKTCQMVGTTATCVTPSSTLNLFFSEYMEGTSNNKALEIFVMSAPSGFNLSSCAIQIFSNGSASVSSTVPLASASLTAGQTFVICHTQWALSYTCDQKGNLVFNGNDALKLVCSGSTQDVFGKVGEDPGAAWTGGGVTTVDVTLRRKCATTAGDTNDADAFDPSVQWTASAIDDVSNLGVFLPCK